MALPVYRSQTANTDPLEINAPLVVDWLVHFLREEVVRRRGMRKAVLGLSGGVDSAVVAFLCARAFGPENVHAIRMPYRKSSKASLDDAGLVVDATGIDVRTIEITSMVDGYAANFEHDISPARLGNICARSRMIVLFDQSAKLTALPIGTGNKTERLFGYYTWHADDAPPINPLGDLFKVQVWKIAQALGVPSRIVDKPASADLIEGQTDEGDFGITYRKADAILHYLTEGFDKTAITRLGYAESDVDLVFRRVDSTHWKRRLPTVAMLSGSAIGEYYLRPVDY